METVFTKEEFSHIKRLNTPTKVQAFINTLKYNAGKRIAVADVLRLRKADCLEAACFASVVLTYHGVENFIMDLSSVRDEDHVLCVFKEKGKYGAVAQSKFMNLRHRHPVYASLRELAMSYFHHYFNFFGELTMRSYSVPVRLPKPGEWMLKVSYVKKLEKELCRIRHITLVEKNAYFPRVSNHSFEREILVMPKGARIGKEYMKKGRH